MTNTQTEEAHADAQAAPTVHETAEGHVNNTGSSDLEGFLSKVETNETLARKTKDTANYMLLQGLTSALKTVIVDGEVDLKLLDNKDKNQEAKNEFYTTSVDAMMTQYQIGNRNTIAMGLAINGILGFPLRNVLDNIMTGSDFNYADIFTQMIRTVNNNVDKKLEGDNEGLAKVSYARGLAQKGGLDPERLKLDTMKPADVLKLRQYSIGEIGMRGVEKESWYKQEAA